MRRKLLDLICDWVNENRRLRERVQFLLEANTRAVNERRDAEKREALWREVCHRLSEENELLKQELQIPQ